MENVPEWDSLRVLTEYADHLNSITDPILGSVPFYEMMSGALNDFARLRAVVTAGFTVMY